MHVRPLLGLAVGSRRFNERDDGQSRNVHANPQQMAKKLHPAQCVRLLRSCNSVVRIWVGGAPVPMYAITVKAIAPGE